MTVCMNAICCSLRHAKGAESPYMMHCWLSVMSDRLPHFRLVHCCTHLLLSQLKAQIRVLPAHMTMWHI